MNRVAVKKFDQRLYARGFSVLPPSEGHWCRDTENRDIGAISFFSNPFLGEYVEALPSKEQASHTFLLEISLVNVDGADISSPRVMKSFMQRWLKNGRMAKMIDDEIYVDMSKNPRFEVIRTHVEREVSLETDCVQYQIDLAERGNPNFPEDWVLNLAADGIVCRHPDSQRLIVGVDISDRRRTEYQDLEARRRLRDQADRTLRSLEFSAL